MTHRLTVLVAFAVLLAGCGDTRPAADTTPTEPAAAEATATPTPFIEKVTGDPTPMPEVTPSGKSEPDIAKRQGQPPAKLVSVTSRSATAPLPNAASCSPSSTRARAGTMPRSSGT